MLATVGAAVCLCGKKTPLHRFLALYTIILTGIYSVIPYKTPWCMLGFLHGMVLLAGVGAASVLEFFRPRACKATIAAVFVALSLHLSWQAWRASVLAWGNERQAIALRQNPYTYAQTVPDILNLVQRAEDIARVAPEGYKTIVKVIAPESDYWPLPWHLRRFQHTGWCNKNCRTIRLPPSSLFRPNSMQSWDEKSTKSGSWLVSLNCVRKTFSSST